MLFYSSGQLAVLTMTLSRSWDEFKAAMTHNEDPSWREGRRDVRSTKVEGLLEALKAHSSLPMPDHGLHIEVEPAMVP